MIVKITLTAMQARAYGPDAEIKGATFNKLASEIVTEREALERVAQFATLCPAVTTREECENMIRNTFGKVTTPRQVTKHYHVYAVPYAYIHFQTPKQTKSVPGIDEFGNPIVTITF